MKIVHVVRQFYPLIGGIENVSLNLAMEQKRQGHTVSVITLNRSFFDNVRLSTEDEYEGINIKRIPFYGSKRYPLAFSSLKYVSDCDLIHIHCLDFFIDFLVLTKLLHGKKIVLHTHGGIFHTKRLLFLKKIYFYTVTRLILLGCSKVIACSKNDATLFRKISNKVICIENGVDIHKYSAINKSIEKGVLLYIGRLDIHKRIDNLIRVTAELYSRDKEVTLKIVGPDWKGIKSSLVRLANSLDISNRVKFLGSVTEDVLIEEMKKANCFVSASEYEGFGISAVEAMASGTFCVLNKIDSFNMFLTNKKYGFLVDFSNVQSASDSIELLLNKSLEELRDIENEAKRDVTKYCWENVVKDLNSVYREVLG